jgi:HK97 family phage prohead protease
MNKKIIKYLSKAPEKKENRVLRFIGSDQSIDRDNERIMVDGWKLTNYRKNPVVLVNHNAFDLPVAKTKKVWIDKEKKQLKFDIEFPEPEVSSVGDTLYKLYANGFMNATSVGFAPNPQKITYGDGKKQPRVTFGEQELLEISLVSVPANPRALLSQKGMKDAIDQKVIDELELDELKSWLDSVLDEDTSVTPEEDQDTDEKLEQTINHVCACCGDELVCVKCKGFDLNKDNSTYLDYFFEDLGESTEIDTKSDDEENTYVNELLNILKTEKENG